jgi:NADH-quinone oxidoreductase subunit E
MNASVLRAVDLSPMERIYEKFKGEPGALLPILRDAQTLYGCLPLEVLRSVARRLGVTLGKVYSVATFYSELHLASRGSHLLQLCDGTVCHLKGAPDLVSAVEDTYGVQPGETTRDRRLTVETVYCLGACAVAPAVMLDGEVAGNLHRDELLDEIKSQLSGPPETSPDRDASESTE